LNRRSDGVDNILDQIVETKKGEVARAKAARPLGALKSMLNGPPPRDLLRAVQSKPSRCINFIAEIKKKSPSAGLIRPDFDPVTIARAYHAHGACGLSVLTDETYFDGRLAYIEKIKSVVDLPVLRKDFIVDLYQIYESRVAGADAVLLIGEILRPAELSEMLDLACSLGMTSLVEVHEVQTLDRLRGTVDFPNDRHSMLGINNRNLRIQKTDLSTTEKLAGMVHKNTVLVSESGIKTHEDVERLIQSGVHALLIGETFMRASDIGAKITEVLGPNG